MTTTVPQSLPVEVALRQAVAHHQAGRLQEAEGLYRAILQAQPNQADANHNLGVLAVQTNQPAAGLPYFKAALETNPNQQQYWLSYIVALMQAGQTNAAYQVLAQVRELGLAGEELDALAKSLETDERVAERSKVVYRQGFNKSLPIASVVIQDRRNEPKLKHAELVTSRRQWPLHNEDGPSLQEINALVALFTEGRYADAANLARTMTVRFPFHGFGWKALGAVFNKEGRSADALAPMQKAAALSGSDAEAHFNLGVTLQELSRLGEAEASYRQAIQINPDYADAHSNLGNTLRELGRLDESETSCRQALRIRPNRADAHYSLGLTLEELGRMDESEASYRRALEIKPDFIAAHCNLGFALLRLSRLDEAEASYRQLLRIKPDLAEAHNNLGIALQWLGRLDEAEVSYLQALQIKPDYVDALNNLALLFNEQGKSMMALNAVKQSLQIKESGEAKSVFVACIRHLRFTQDDSAIRATMVRALLEPWCRPSELEQAGIDLIKLSPEISGCIGRATGAWPVRLSARELFGSNGLATIAADSLLNALLDSAPICDIEMERLLTMARRTMLEVATRVTASGDEIGAAMGFYSALARQCFINEYVFAYADDEIAQASDLRDSLVAALRAQKQVPALWPIAIAAYFPLGSLPSANRLLEKRWPEEVVAVLTQQVREPAEELLERKSIPRLTDIEDTVSLLVQDQYEENPYPRWIRSAPVGKAKNLVEYLSQKFPLAPLKHYGRRASTEVLIAGCGTGQHSIETAQQIQSARVLAVDLSIGSLGYAKRKTRELGLSDIEYGQADLTKLGSLGRSFDVIESCGVLHHLADPWAGWRVLLSLLRPSGFMRLGFYSEVARRNVVRIRAFIARQGYGAAANEIRRCRQELLNLNESADLGNTLESPDFFSISACRDLLFHVQEHRMTLTAIDTFVRANKLTFLGFEVDGDVLHAYKLRFPDDLSATNLDQWQMFENEYPDTFFGMYQFWIQKAG